MGKTVTIFCKNTGRTHRVPLGFNLEEVYELLEIKMPHGVTSAKVNNKVEGLHFALFNDKDIEFLDVTSPSGMRTYTRSLFFVLYKAVHDLYPKGRLRIDTPVSNGYYCRLDGEFDVDVIRRRMQEIVDADLPFHRVTCHTSEAIALFREHGLENKAKLLEGLGSLYTNYYTLDDVADYFYGSLLIRTGQIRLFDVVPYGDGLLLRLPDPENPEQLRPMVEQSKMFDVFREQHRWQEILGVSTIGELNKANDLGLTNQLINVTEALQEKKISQLADRIAANPKLKVILIAGPSSSGKTTFSKRLSVQLMACGVKPIPVSLDDYFVDREKTPRNAAGDFDYEHIEAMNIPLFNQQMNALLQGEEVELPRYNFQTGLSEKSGNRLRLAPDMLLILEGIHALNPMLTKDIPEENKHRQPPAPPHRARLQIPRLFGAGHHQPLAGGACGRGALDIPLSGAGRRDDQHRAALRVRRPALAGPAAPGTGAGECARVFRGLSPAQVPLLPQAYFHERPAAHLAPARVSRRKHV